MNIVEKFPCATDEQRRKLIEAQKAWDSAIKERGDPPHNGSLDGMSKDYYGDITKKLQNAIKKIMET